MSAAGERAETGRAHWLLGSYVTMATGGGSTARRGGNSARSDGQCVVSRRSSSLPSAGCTTSQGVARKASKLTFYHFSFSFQYFFFFQDFKFVDHRYAC